MEIIKYGINFWGTEIVAFETLEDINAITEYDWVLICKRNPDKYGNGSYIVTIFDAHQQLPIKMNGGWKLSDMHGYWDWNNHYLTLYLIDGNGTECNLCRNFGKRPTLTDILIEGIETILDIGQHYTNVLECQLILLNTPWGTKYKDEEYWNICAEYVHNPIYQRQVSEEQKEQIQKEIYTRVCQCLEKKNKEYRELYDRYTELQTKYNNLEEKQQSQDTQTD